MFGEPGDGTFEHPDRGLRLLIGTDLDVGDSGVVIDHGVEVAGTDVGVADGCVAGAAAGGGLAVEVALVSSEEAMPSAIGDVANLVMSTWSIAPGWGCS